MEQRMTCGICQSIFFDPVKLLDCLHIYCGSCIKPWLQASGAACPHCRQVPRAVTSDRFINDCVEGFLTDYRERAPSEAEKAEHRRVYQPGTDISPSVPFISPAEAGGPSHGRINMTPATGPARVVTPEISEVIEEISRTPSRVEIAARPRARIASPSFDQLLPGQSRARLPVSNPDGRGYGCPQYANTINNYFYSSSPAPVPQQQAQPTPAYSPYGVIVNGTPLDTAGYLQLMSTGIVVQPGTYWYDSRSGLYGFQWGPCSGQILPGMSLGGRLASNASGYPSTNIYINGREIHGQEALSLRQWGVYLTPGRKYWLEANGSYGREGVPFPPEGNLRMLSASIMSSYMISRAMQPGCVIL